METDRRSCLSGHRPGNTAIRPAFFPASEAARRCRSSVQHPRKSRPSVHIRMMTAKGSKGNLDPSRFAAHGATGIPAGGRGDRVGLRDSADDDDWRCVADSAGLGRGNADCNSAAHDRNAGRGRTSPGIHRADKPAAAEPLRHEPTSALAGRARQRQWLRGTLELVHVGACRRPPHRNPVASDVRGSFPNSCLRRHNI